MSTNNEFKDMVRKDMDRNVTFVVRSLLNSVRPIYGADKNSEPFLIGSCVLLQIDSRRFILTTAHVLDENRKKDEPTTLYIGGEKLVPFLGEFYFPPMPQQGREYDNIDIGFMELNEQMVQDLGNVSYLSTPDIDVNDIAHPGHQYLVLGYPCSKNKKLNYYNKTIPLKPFVYSSTPSSTNIYQKLNISELTHVLISFNKNKVTDVDGRIFTSADPYGVSGGGMWRLHDYAVHGHSDNKLVGIVIEWHSEDKNVLMATRINVLLEAIKSQYPSLTDCIPISTRLKINITNV